MPVGKGIAGSVLKTYGIIVGFQYPLADIFLGLADLTLIDVNLAIFLIDKYRF